MWDFLAPWCSECLLSLEVHGSSSRPYGRGPACGTPSIAGRFDDSATERSTLADPSRKGDRRTAMSKVISMHDGKPSGCTRSRRRRGTRSPADWSPPSRYPGGVFAVASPGSVPPLRRLQVRPCPTATDDRETGPCRIRHSSQSGMRGAAPAGALPRTTKRRVLMIAGTSARLSVCQPRGWCGRSTPLERRTVR